LDGTFREFFTAAPAAKGVHHPWIGGLLEHVLGLCELADATYENHYKYYLPHLRMDLVKFGLMFHDWGKIFEYDYSTPDIKYTMHGALMHHMGIVCDAITRAHVKYESMAAPEEFFRSKAIHRELLHIVYSHHGKAEWGSIMTPATPEALFVHLLDYMDAKMMHMQDLIASGVEGDIPGMSKYSYMEKAAYVMPKGVQ
jgi:3'-5' exoribonuclease